METFNLKLKKIKLLAIIFLPLFFVNYADAASLTLSPSSGSYTTGKNFSVKIIVSSPDQSANAVSGSLFFPKEKIEVTSISKVGSVINFWVQEPIFSNNSGLVNFEGLVLNPGFSGSYGEVIIINFRTKTAGQARLGFSEGVVLANDGLGTNILDTLGTASFTIEATATGPGADNSSTPSVVLGTPQAVVISSPTHPSSSAWYSNDEAKFVWKSQPGVTATKLLVGKSPVSLPTVLYTKPINEKTIEDLDDGIWYLHVQEKNSNGWGAVAHFKVQIDVTPPKPFTLDFKKEGNVSLQPLVAFNSQDVTSGIDYYNVRVDGKDSIKITEIDSEIPFLIPIQDPGNHLVVVEAFDKAGNSNVTSGEFETVAIDAPLILDYPYKLTSKETLIIKGETFPNSKVEILLEDENGKITQQDINIDEDGDFVLVWSEKLDYGIYKFRAIVTDERGARSIPTEDFIISVDGSFLGAINSMTLYILSLIGIIGIIFIGMFFLAHLRHRIILLRRKLNKEVDDVDAGIEKVFRLLRDDVKEHIIALSKARMKRDLTVEETKILKGLMKNFNDAEIYLKKEIKDVKEKLDDSKEIISDKEVLREPVTKKLAVKNKPKPKPEPESKKTIKAASTKKPRAKKV